MGGHPPTSVKPNTIIARAPEPIRTLLIAICSVYMSQVGYLTTNILTYPVLRRALSARSVPSGEDRLCEACCFGCQD